MVKDVFGFSECQGKADFGLGYRLKLTRNTDNAFFNEDNEINNAKTKNNALQWYVPHYTPSISDQAILPHQILNKKPTELQNLERSGFMKEVKTQNLWSFELRTQDRINVPIWIIVGLKQRDRQASQILNSDT